jgi:hypothetical protein
MPPLRHISPYEGVEICGDSVCAEFLKFLFRHRNLFFLPRSEGGRKNFLFSASGLNGWNGNNRGVAVVAVGSRRRGID